MEAITARELREILFEVEDQELTVRDLRNILFQVSDQDKELTAKELYLLTQR